MAVKVYVICVSEVINFMVDNDLEGFKNYLAEEGYLGFDEPKFSTPRQKLLPSVQV